MNGYWAWVALGLCLLAGAGLKWAIDRMFPPVVHVAGLHAAAAPPPVPEARKTLEFEDTMDVLGSGFLAGQQSRNPYALPPRGEPSRLSGRVYHDDGGWISGPCQAPEESLAPGNPADTSPDNPVGTLPEMLP